MAAPTLELADIFRQHGPAYRQTHSLPWHQQRLMQAIENCRTPALGAAVEWCSQCQFTHICYRSCRNRHCPKCQGMARERWIEDRRAELLPCEYFHVVFTLPQPVARLAFYNKQLVFNILFQAAAEALLGTAAQRLGVELGFFCILHSWGQNLHFHPHLHCVVPGGGLSPGHQRWIAAKRRFLLPVKVLSPRFRRLVLKALRRAYSQGKLQFPGPLHVLGEPSSFTGFLQPLQRLPWVVYAKPPFGGPAHVLEYLGRYTHRVAIGNRRLLSLENGKVSFSWTDYRDSKKKVMTVATDEFIRLFLQHSLPTGFQRIRYYGFLANCHRALKIALCRRLLFSPVLELLPQAPSFYSVARSQWGFCPKCKVGVLARLFLPPAAWLADTS